MGTWGEFLRQNNMSVINRSDIYNDCFGSEYTTVWGELKQFSPLKNDWCYQRALSAFVREGRQGERQIGI
jgi:hypothetical protein